MIQSHLKELPANLCLELELLDNNQLFRVSVAHPISAVGCRHCGIDQIAMCGTRHSRSCTLLLPTHNSATCPICLEQKAALERNRLMQVVAEGILKERDYFTNSFSYE